MAKLVDARDSKSRGGDTVSVRVRLPAPKKGCLMAANCVFCKIVTQELPAQVVDEDRDCIVIEDIAPKAPVHYLIIPKKHIESLHAAQPEDVQLLGNLMLMAKKIGQQLPDPKAFGLIINNGEEAGQSVLHLHCHFLSGKRMTDL